MRCGRVIYIHGDDDDDDDEILKAGTSYYIGGNLGPQEV